MALCFMIMPYGRRATQVEPSSNAPGEIDFNALWDRAFRPAIQSLGYDPVRADQDTGALIINQMIERIYFADLVLADMTIPNGNVYYEVGVRHAAKKTGCVLLAAEWSKQLFDVAQMRTVRYPLSDGEVGEPAANGVVKAISVEIEKRKDGCSPVHDSINGYPDAVDERAASTMKDAMTAFANFQGELSAVRALSRDSRMERAKELVDKYWKPPFTPLTALSLLRSLKNCAENSSDWSWITDFIGNLPPYVAGQEEVRELDAFALANAGKPIDAIAKLEALIAQSGPTPERYGILGGRYKRLYAGAAPQDKSLYLSRSIDAYERGMELDLNDYYCSSNLPRLYKVRKRKGDDERALSVSQIVMAACGRARKLNLADEWLPATLLCAAFDAGDAEKAEELAEEIAAEGAARWKLDSLLGDLRASVAQVEDKDRRDRLAAILKSLTPSATV
jgi:hypothetical protein